MRRKTKTLLLLCLTGVILTTGCGKLLPAAKEKAEPASSKNVTEKTDSASDEESKYVPSLFTQADVDSDTVQWFCSAYAIYTEINNKDLGCIGGTSEENIDMYQDAIKNALLSGWSISGRESALKQIDKLITSGHRKEYQDFIADLDERNLLDLTEEELLNRASAQGGDVSRFRGAYRANQAFGDKALDGWDYCRALQVLGDCYQAGYINLEECLDTSLLAAKTLQSQFKSWDEVAQSYIYGYYFWQGDKIEATSRWETYEQLAAMPDGPYSVPFDTELKESWKNVTAAKQNDDPAKTKAAKDAAAESEANENGLYTLYDIEKKNKITIKLPSGYKEDAGSTDQLRLFSHYNEENPAASSYLFYSLVPFEETMEQDMRDLIDMRNQMYQSSEDSIISDTKSQKVKDLTVNYIVVTSKKDETSRTVYTWAALDDTKIMQCEINEGAVSASEFPDLEDEIKNFYSGIQK